MLPMLVFGIFLFHQTFLNARDKKLLLQKNTENSESENRKPNARN